MYSYLKMVNLRNSSHWRWNDKKDGYSSYNFQLQETEIPIEVFTITSAVPCNGYPGVDRVMHYFFF